MASRTPSLRIALFLPVAVSAVVPAAGPARAEPNDDLASKLRSQAVYEDYLVTRFDEARAKLLKAMDLCGGARDCSSTLRARLRCDLGVVDFALDAHDDARADFAEALKLDPAITIDHDLSTPALEKEFVAAGGERLQANAVRDVPRAPEQASGSGRTGSDCPPGFPGCSQAADSDEESTAAAPTPPSSKGSLVSVHIQADALVLPSARNVCAGGSGYTCYNGSTYDAARPVADAADVVNGGLRLATIRVLVGYERAIAGNFTLGGRLGYAFRGGPQRPGARSFDPIHLEVRASYWIGAHPLERAGLRPFLTASAGLAEVDASVPAEVYSSSAAYQAGQSDTYSAWRKVGLGFGAIGIGAMYAVTGESGIVVGLEGIESFPTTGTGLGVQFGYAVGL